MEMTPPQKPVVLLSSGNLAGLQELRSLLNAWFDVRVVDIHKVEASFNAGAAPYAVIMEVDADEPKSRPEVLRLLDGLRQCHPHVRRIVITDHCDLALVIQGLHSGAINNLIYRPFSIAEVTAALRPLQVRPGVGAAPGIEPSAAQRSPNVPQAVTATRR